MSTAHRGRAAEGAILNAFLRMNLAVLVPFGDGHPYDLVVHVPPDTFLRVQCKTAWPGDGCLIFRSTTTDHGNGPQSYLGIADTFAVYCPASGGVFLIPVRLVSTKTVSLRLEPARNNQRRRIWMAADYEIGRWSVEMLRGLVSTDSASMVRAG